MKIIHVVTLVTPDGAFGGPARVAFNQARALIDDGHDVTVAAGYTGFENSGPPDSIDEVPVALFPAIRVVPRSGFAGLVAPRLATWVLDQLKDGAVQAVHVHLARDLITLPVAESVRRRGARYVVQTHGMIDHSTHLMARPLDALLTRSVLADAAAVYCLHEAERRTLVELAGAHAAELDLVILPNSLPARSTSDTDETDDTETSHEKREVLFLARLHARKRPLFFVEMAIILAARFPEVVFTLVGPDGGEGRGVERRISTSGYADRISWEGGLPPEETLRRMKRAYVYVLPTLNEPFGMTVLESMSVGLPVVVTQSCGLAGMVKSTRVGLVADETIDGLVEAVSRLLTDTALWESSGARAKQVVTQRYGMQAIVETLKQGYVGRDNDQS